MKHQQLSLQLEARESKVRASERPLLGADHKYKYTTETPTSQICKFATKKKQRFAFCRKKDHKYKYTSTNNKTSITPVCDHRVCKDSLQTGGEKYNFDTFEFFTILPSKDTSLSSTQKQMNVISERNANRCCCTNRNQVILYFKDNRSILT